ncbi:MAG: hypothetical protein J6K26_00360 [Lachnospiraceae bacterium]|nr:hypothetical protein [Lachnospiraceae bacterium]
MEKFLDELILSERKKRQGKILDEQIDLERDLPEQYLQTIVMPDNAASIKIPAFMKDLPEKSAEQKYEFEPRPQIIKSTQSGNINFTFSLLDVSVEPGQLEAVCQCCKRAWRRILPEMIFYEESEEEINGIRVRWMEYSNNAAGGKLYNLLFYAATERTLVGSMNCPYNKHEVWVKIAKLCMRTLRGKRYDTETAADHEDREGTDGTGIYGAAPGTDQKL